MVERIILFRLNDSNERAELAARTHAALSALPELEELSVGVPADAASERSWDLSVVLALPNLALLASLLDSAPFRAWFEGTMKDRYAVIKAWNFERVA